MHTTVSAHLTLFRVDYTVNKEYELYRSSLFMSLYEDKKITIFMLHNNSGYEI